jgi:hypothetical protein
MTLSFTNKSLQPNVSASDSSSFIGLHHNLEHNAHLKVKRYNVGEDSSHGETARVVQFQKHVLSVVCGSGSIPLKPHSFKSNTKSSFDVSRQPVLGQSMIGPVVKLPLAAPCSQRGWLVNN